MGVVYKAEDTKLDRTVALKFLPQHLTTTDTERARFLQEAKAAAALNHPNVCVIHEIQDSADEPFIVMEYVDGQTIRDVVGANGRSPLSVDDALKYAIQIDEARAFANPNIEPGSISFSYDDKEAVYATKRISGKLVMIEDFIK